MKYNKLIFGSLASLILGTLIYVLFRASSLKVFSWLDFLGIDITQTELRKQAISITSILPKWILFSLPDGLWIFSYVCLMLSIWKGAISTRNIFWISIISLVAIGSEIAQLSGLVQGTFDFSDVLLYFIGSLLPLILYKNSINYNFKF